MGGKALAGSSSEEMQKSMALTYVDLQPEEVMMIGDSLTADMAGAGNYGMNTCWLNRKEAGMPENMALDHVVTRLFQIQELL